MRIGIGYDIHPLKAGRKLVLGGVDIPFEKGLDGWSDADALVHAIMDALLGAAALGDIGSHFPPGNEEFKDISSVTLLERTRHILSETGWTIGNVDATVIAERPKLRDYIDAMRQNISRALAIDVSRVSVKASTSNGVGSLGNGDGIAAYAAALIEGRQ
ncbi:MAG: 2-C-methyl-D-erythritol 2,4-cyclodiphosphate synthase [Dehalococcoidales bacterium]|nr:2-C-methyl-D-erythritol 2,4-cyclodiphosphate synthase [Dehalococcoidales bacterium]